MQRIAVLLLCGMACANAAQADPCDNVASIVGGFAGGATGYGLIQTIGPATNWVAAGLYGAGIAAASIATRAGVTANCDTLVSAVRWYGEMSCRYSTFDYDCEPVAEMANSLAADFAMCPGCTFDEVMGAFLLADGFRQGYLEYMQRARWGRLATTTQVVPRDHLGTFSSSVLNSYYVGMQAGFSRMTSRSMSIMLK